MGSEKGVHGPVVSFAVNGRPGVADILRCRLEGMLRGDGAAVAIGLRVVGRDPIVVGFGVHAKIGVKGAIFLTGDEDVLDGGGISRAGGSWANGRGRGGSRSSPPSPPPLNTP